MRKWNFRSSQGMHWLMSDLMFGWAMHVVTGTHVHTLLLIRMEAVKIDGNSGRFRGMKLVFSVIS